MKIDATILDYLRKNLPIAFIEATGMQMLISNDPDNPFYGELSDSIKHVLELVKNRKRSPGGHTFCKLFFETDNQEYDPQTIYILQKYCIAVFAKRIINNQNSVNISTAAYVIDDEFLIRVEVEGNHHAKDFYKAKQAGHCQWYGIIKEWDFFSQSFLEEVRNEVLASYDLNGFDAIVAAVIHGNGGCGKSTFLRHLAVIMKSDLVVIWVNELDSFIVNDLQNIILSSVRHLLIIDDWTQLANDEPLISKLFLKMNHSKSVRLIIGDRSISKRAYKKYVYGNNFFEITFQNNEDIIRHVLSTNSEWEKIVETFIFNEIYKAPIFLILFVIARESEIGNKGTTKAFSSRFLEIMEYDLRVIENKNPALAKLFYCCAILYGRHWQTLTWSALVNLAKGISPENYQILLTIYDAVGR